MDEKAFSVNLWGSHPDANNDDCWIGDDFSDLASAMSAFQEPEAHFAHDPGTLGDSVYIEIVRNERRDGKVYCDRLQLRRLLTPEQEQRMKRRHEREDRAWKHEIAMQAGMLGGIDAYNAHF